MRSGLEREVAAILSRLKLKYTYEEDKLPYVIEHNYIPDFRVGDIYIECKGWFKSTDRRKMLAVKKSHPDLDIRFVFQSPYNKLSKRSKTTYAMWADKHGFPWCASYAIPISWLKCK